MMGLSAGCYWTAADAAVIDVTPKEQHSKAFAVLILSDSLGIGFGILGGETYLSQGLQPRLLFLIGGLILLIFLILIQFAIVDAEQKYS